MHIPKRYLHDRVVLLLLSINVFLTFLMVALILLRIGGGQGSESYIVQYRENLGIIGAFKTGSLSDILGFVAFALLVLITNVVLSFRAYLIRRELAVSILALGILLAGLALIVSNSLLGLR